MPCRSIPLDPVNALIEDFCSRPLTGGLELRFHVLSLFQLEGFVTLFKPTPILYVDDDPLARQLMVRSLDKSKFEVSTAANGYIALEMVARGDFTIVVTDIDMPGIDGVDLIRQLESRYPALLFVVVTGQPQLASADLTSAVTSFVAKPWHVDDITDVLERTAALKRLRTGRRHGLEGQLLIVEDDPIDVEMLLMTLEQIGWDRKRIRNVTTLSSALDLLRSETFDVIISDLGLPDARCMDSVQRLREAAPKTALVLHTGNADEAVALQAVQLGAHEYLLKTDSGPPTLRRAIRYAQERASAERRLVYAASHDTLTGLCNRASVQERASRAFARARRKGTALGVLYIDLNGFKKVNDTLGHAAGDAVLIHVAQQLESAVRDGDTVARLGGDEFVVLVEHVDSCATMRLVIRRVRRALAAPIPVANAMVSTEASVGVAMFPEEGDCLDELLLSADRAMYDDKFSDTGARRGDLTRMTWPAAARAALGASGDTVHGS